MSPTATPNYQIKFTNGQKKEGASSANFKSIQVNWEWIRDAQNQKERGNRNACDD